MRLFKDLYEDTRVGLGAAPTATGLGTARIADLAIRFQIAGLPPQP